MREREAKGHGSICIPVVLLLVLSPACLFLGLDSPSPTTGTTTVSSSLGSSLQQGSSNASALPRHRFPGARKSCFQVKTRIRIADGLPVNLALISLPACLARCKNKIRCRKDPWRACAIRQQKAGEREIVRGLGR